MNSCTIITGLHILKILKRTNLNSNASFLLSNINDVHAKSSCLCMSSIIPKDSVKKKVSSQNEQEKHNVRPKFRHNRTKQDRDLDQKDSDIQFKIFLNSEKNNPDTFGSLSEDWTMHKKLDKMPEEEGEVIVTEFLKDREGKKRLTVNQYGKIIKKFLAQKKLGLALEVLEKRMLKEDRATPDQYHYNLLITGCGKAGYLKKAFQLHKQMRTRGLKTTKHTYTSLFNACANSPTEFVEEALQRARHLRANLQEQGFPLTPILYNAMIKAFGRCGDLETAFLLVDEMLENNLGLANETFNFLLQACISDKDAGFRSALLVYWKMRQKRIKPNIFTFNLLLRCSRDCGLGDEKSTHQVIQAILSSNQKNQEVSRLQGPVATTSDSKLTTVSSTDSMPNLISRTPTMGNVVALTTVNKPEHRLMLMGGCRGVLEQMNFYKVKPDIKTFTQLLDQIPSTLQAEQELLESIKAAELPIDIDFYNMLIRKRCYREDHYNAKEVLRLITNDNLKPNLLTYGVLGMACRDAKSALEVLSNMDAEEIRPNIEILGAMLTAASFERDCDYVIEVLKRLKKEELKPDNKFLSRLHAFYILAKRCVDSQEYSEKLNKEKFDRYLKLYHSLKKTLEVEEPPHPWEQFRDPAREPEDMEIMNRFKSKLRNP